MLHDNIFGVHPVLKSKVLDINVARTFSGDTVVGHIDSEHSVLKSGVGPSCGYPSSKRTAPRHFACFAAVTAARDSASVLEVAVVD